MWVAESGRADAVSVRTEAFIAPPKVVTDFRQLPVPSVSPPAPEAAAAVVASEAAGEEEDESFGEERSNRIAAPTAPVRASSSCVTTAIRTYDRKQVQRERERERHDNRSEPDKRTHKRTTIDFKSFDICRCVPGSPAAGQSTAHTSSRIGRYSGAAFGKQNAQGSLRRRPRHARSCWTRQSGRLAHGESAEHK